MALPVRRVITGHDGNGRVVGTIDEVATHVVPGRPGATTCNVWTTVGFPATNDSDTDLGLRKVGTTLPNGTIDRPRHRVRARARRAQPPEGLGRRHRRQLR
jgi:hypothetical protein